MTKPHIAVVGAGIVGICAAYFLSKSGFKVTLIDKNDPGVLIPPIGVSQSFYECAAIPLNFVLIPFCASFL